MVADPRYIIKEEPNEIPKMPMAESLTCGTFARFLVILLLCCLCFRLVAPREEFCFPYFGSSVCFLFS